jgi:hypothetical protein
MDSNEHEKNSFRNIVVDLKMPEDRVRVKHKR